MNIGGLIYFIIIMLFLLAIGVWAGKKTQALQSQEDYYIAGGKMGTLVLTCTIVATSVGGGMMLSWVGMGATNGIGAFWYGAVQCIGGVMAILFVVTPYRKGKFISLPDFFHKAYQNKALTIGITIVALIAPITWACGQFKVAATMLEGLLGIPLNTGILIFGLAIIAYTTIGGFSAVAYTDTIQAIIMFSIWAVVMPMTVVKAGGLTEMFANVEPALNSWNPFKIAGYPWYTIICWFAMGFTCSLGMQSSYQRFSAGKSDRIVKFGLKVNAIVCVIVAFVSAFAGMAISTMNPDVSGDTALTWFLSAKVPFIIALAYMTCIIMATASSADSMLNTFAMNVGRDIYQKFVNPKASDKSALRVGVVASALFGIVSIIWAMNSSGLIVTIFGAASNMSSAPLVGVMYLTVFCKKHRTAWGMFAGRCFGVLVGVATSYWIPGISEIPSAGSIFATAGTMIVGYLVSRFTGGRNGEKFITDPFGLKSAGSGDAATATAITGEVHEANPMYPKLQLFASALFPFLYRAQ